MLNLIKLISVVNGAGAVHGFLQSLVIGLRRRGNRTANRIFAVLLFLFSIGMADSFYYSSHLYLDFPGLIGLTGSLILTYGPIFYLYVLALTSRPFHFKKKDLLHFLPFGTAVIYSIPLILSNAENKLVMIKQITQKPGLGNYFWIFFGVAQALVYIVLVICLLKKHSRGIKESFSAIEQINLRWINHFMIAFGFGWFVVFILYSFSILHPDLRNQAGDIIYLFVAIIVFAIGYRGLAQPAIFSLPAAEPIRKKYEKSVLSKENAELYQNRLLDLMETEKPYLEPQLTMQQIAERLDIPAYQLSQIINEKLKRNFYEFVNRYRIENAKTLLADPKMNDDKLIKIAFAVGFNSLSTFNRVFKELTGQTPSAFRKNQK